MSEEPLLDDTIACTQGKRFQYIEESFLTKIIDDVKKRRQEVKESREWEALVFSTSEDKLVCQQCARCTSPSFSCLESPTQSAHRSRHLSTIIEEYASDNESNSVTSPGVPEEEKLCKAVESKEERDNRYNPFIMEVIKLRQKIEIILICIFETMDRIPQPDGLHDAIRRQRRALEFTSRLSRNYIYQLRRKVLDVKQQVKGVCPITGGRHTFYVCFLRKLIAGLQSASSSLEAYLKHMPNSIVRGLPEKLDEMLTLLGELLTISKEFSEITGNIYNGPDKLEEIYNRLKLKVERVTNTSPTDISVKGSRKCPKVNMLYMYATRHQQKLEKCKSVKKTDVPRKRIASFLQSRQSTLKSLETPPHPRNELPLPEHNGSSKLIEEYLQQLSLKTNKEKLTLPMKHDLKQNMDSIEPDERKESPLKHQDPEYATELNNVKLIIMQHKCVETEENQRKRNIKDQHVNENIAIKHNENEPKKRKISENHNYQETKHMNTPVSSVETLDISLLQTVTSNSPQAHSGQRSKLTSQLISPKKKLIEDQKSKSILQTLNLSSLEGKIIQRYQKKLMLLRHNESLYRKSIQPWTVIARIADNIVDNTVREVLQEAQIDDLLHKLYDLEFS